MAEETKPQNTPRKRFVPEYIRTSAIKRIIRESGRQCSEEFLMCLDAYVSRKTREACAVHDGSAKRLNAVVAGHVGIV